MRDRRGAASQFWRIAMFNEAQISLIGYVATQPFTKKVGGADKVSMRVAWTPRRQDKTTGEWTDGNTSYVNVVCWRKLANNVAISLRTGDPVVVMGRLSVRPYEDKTGVRRIAVDVDASAIGHDLSRGVSTFRRVRPPTGMTAAEFAAAQAAGQIPDGAAGPRGEDSIPGGNGHAIAAGLGRRPDDAAELADPAGEEGWLPGDADSPPADEPAQPFFDESAISENDVTLEPAPAPS
jgi:single-strand DNA-binding protein